MLQALRQQADHRLFADPMRRWVGPILLTVGVGVAYFLAARLSLLLLTKPDGVAVFWPAAGIAAGVLIALGPGARWPVAAGAIIATIAANLLGDRNLPSVIVFGVCNATEALLAAWLIEWRFGPRFELDRLSHVLGLVVASVMATSVSGVGGTLGYLLFHSSTVSALTIWGHWFAADTLGIITVAPLLIGLRSTVRNPPPTAEFIEGIGALAVLTAVSMVAVFSRELWMAAASALLFPLLLWLSARCRPAFASAAAFITPLAIVWSTTFEMGYYGDPSVPISDRILAARGTILGASLCALVLAALFAERRQSEARLQQALAVGRVAAFDWDVLTDLLQGSESAPQILGFDPRETLTATWFLQRIHPDDRARYEELVSSARPNNPSFSVVLRFIRPDGQQVWLEKNSKAEFDSMGRLVRVKCLTVDITERRQHEAAAVESEERLQEALTVGAVMAFDWEPSTDLTRRSNNAAEILGLEPQQIFNGASFLARVHPDDLARVKALWSTLNRDSPTTYSVSYRFLRLDGREIWLLEKTKAEFDAAGRLLRFKGLARDITERKHANIRIAADLEAMKRLHRVGAECARGENELSYCLNEIVEAAIAIVGANKGNIQLFDRTSGALTIAAQRGFEAPFLKHFACVSDANSACGVAMQSSERVLVEDVAQSEIFIGRPSLKVLLDAGVRAIISVPLVSSSRGILGMLSTHFRSPHQPSERELQLLDLLARQAADYLERKAADEQQKMLVAKLEDDEGRMRAIVNTAQNGIVTIDDEGMIENLNPAAARIFGYGPEQAIGCNVNMLMPDPFRGEHNGYLKKYFDTGQAKVLGIERELTGLRRDGSTFPMELTVSEIAMAGRRMFVGVVHDITNRMRNAERQKVLMAELDHRVKNTLARVAMLAASTRKGSSTIDKYVSTFEGRIQSMAVAHDLLSQGGWYNVGLRALVGMQLAPYASGSNVTVKGEDIVLGPAEIQAVAMVLHELVTNAAKYGSLSVPDGRVRIRWVRVNLDAGAKLVVEWRELGGPSVAAEIPSGYGTSLIRDLIPHELGGMVDLIFASDGVSCKIEIPLEKR